MFTIKAKTRQRVTDILRTRILLRYIQDAWIKSLKNYLKTG